MPARRKSDLTVRGITAASTLAVAALWPAVAVACPYCAGRNDGGKLQLVWLALFVFFPFAVVLTIARIIKAGNRES